MVLLAKIIQKIQSDGPLNLADYMAMALYDPDFGYYTTGQPFGKEGDFTTAPELTPLFGQTLARWVTAQWERLGKPDTWQLVEVGPGRGKLLAALLPEAPTGGQVTCVEVSPALIEIQQKTLKDHKVTWVTSLQDVDWSLPTILIANEVLDALPIQQFERNEAGDWCEKKVGENAGNLVFLHEKAVKMDEKDIHFLETHAALENWLMELKQNLHIGAALMIDYGFTGPAHADTLQALKGHAYADVLANPGQQDLTAHVPFNKVAAILSGDCTLTDMSPFLLQHGFATLATQALETADSLDAKASIEGACHRLLAPNAMGQLFKALEWKPAKG